MVFDSIRILSADGSVVGTLRMNANGYDTAAISIELRGHYEKQGGDSGGITGWGLQIRPQAANRATLIFKKIHGVSL